MNETYINEDTPNVINNEYDYSNIIATIEGITYLIQYCDNVYKQFLNLMEEDKQKNEPLKYEFQNYTYKKGYYDRLDIYIREKTYNNITCKDFESFKTAVNNGNLKNITSMEIKLDLYYKRGKNDNLTDYENSFTIVFKPYEIIFARKSNHNEVNMNQIENNINEIMKKFPTANSVFCTK